jgi:hypothetical protein
LNVVEFKIIPLGPTSDLRESDYDMIMMFLQHLELDNGVLITGYKKKPDCKLAVRYKTVELKERVLKTHIFYVSTECTNRRFKLIANEELSHSYQDYQEIKNIVIMVARDDVENEKAKIFCENLLNNKINVNGDDKQNGIKSIETSVFFENSFIIEFNNDGDFSRLTARNKDFSFLKAYRSKILLVNQNDTKGRYLDQELVEAFFRRKNTSGENFRRIFIKEPCYMVEFESDAICKQYLLNKSKHEQLGHELEIEYLYNLEMLNNFAPKSNENKPMPNEEGKACENFLTQMEQFGLFCLILFFMILFNWAIIRFFSIGSDFPVTYESNKSIVLQRYQLKLIRRSEVDLSKINDMSIVISESKSAVELRGTVEQIERAEKVIHSIVNDVNSARVQLNSFQMRFLIEKEAGLEKFSIFASRCDACIALDIIDECLAFSYDLVASQITLFSKYNISCKYLLSYHVLREIEWNCMFVKDIKDHSLIVDYVNKVNREMDGVLVEYVTKENGGRDNAYLQYSIKLRFIGVESQINKAKNLYINTFYKYGLGK